MSFHVTVLGSGSWGTALAQAQAQAGQRVTLWDRNPDHLADIQATRQNRKYHPGIDLDKGISVESSIEKALATADMVILGIPSHAIRKVVSPAVSAIKPGAFIASAAKGIETDTMKTPAEIIEDLLGKARAQKCFSVWSGPSFAKEVIQGLPSALTVASKEIEVIKKIQGLCQTDTFRLLGSDDVVGVEIAGALKNVIAIVAGVCDGFELGLNARAGLITRGLAEISMIGKAKGAHPMTFQGLAGLGDVILTCTGDLSRNRRVGLHMAQGKTLRQIMKDLGQVAEGIRTTKAAYRMASDLKIDAPLIEETYLAIYEGKSPERAVKDLISRIPRSERGE